MSRESLASLSTATVSGLPERPEPPEYLSERESALWREVVATKPADWFLRDSQPILAQYCKNVILHRDISERLDKIDIQTADPKELEKIIGMACKVSALCVSLAVKMRLTQQSRYTSDRAATQQKKHSAPSKPWEKVG
jgi:hypothetical protein